MPRKSRDCYGAYESGDRSIVEAALGENFTFYSPPDPGIDRATYFKRCWPNSELLESIELVRLIESGDQVITFDGDKISMVEVYFGWDLE